MFLEPFMDECGNKQHKLVTNPLIAAILIVGLILGTMAGLIARREPPRLAPDIVYPPGVEYWEPWEIEEYEEFVRHIRK